MRERVANRLASLRLVGIVILTQLGRESGGDLALCNGWDVGTFAQGPPGRSPEPRARHASSASLILTLCARFSDRSVNNFEILQTEDKEHLCRSQR